MFEPRELLEIDQIIVNKAIVDYRVEQIMKGKLVTEEDVNELKIKAIKELGKDGMYRVVNDINDWVDDKYGNVRVMTTSEARDRQAWFQDRTAILQYLTPEDPRYNAIVDSIMDEMGITLDDIQLAMEQNTVAGQAPSKQPEIAPEEQQAAALQTKQ